MSKNCLDDLITENYKNFLFGFCEYKGRGTVLRGQVVWGMIKEHYMEGRPIREVAALNQITKTTAHKVLIETEAKFRRYNVWKPEFGFPRDCDLHHRKQKSASPK